MIRARQDRQDKARSGRHRRRPLAANPLFVPVLGLWGAALGGLVTLVMPREQLSAAAGELGLGAFDAAAPFVLAGLAALVLGGTMLLVGRALARKALRPVDVPSLAAMAMRHVRTIDPASDLGSGSLDEPVETIPFSRCEPEAMADRERALESVPDTPPPPQTLDLAEFAALPGRNAVWVDAPLAVDADEAAQTAQPALPSLVPEVAPHALPSVAESAIERLRAVPPNELSMAQMVERFAAALHERQSAAVRAGQRRDPAGRDAALAEALRTLAALSNEGRSAADSAPLREALTRLQELRGAA